MDLKSAVDIVIERLKEREVINPVDAQKLFEFSVMSRGIQTAMDSMAGINGYMEEYRMYQLLNSIPDDPSKIEGGRGTPLNENASITRSNQD